MTGRDHEREDGGRGRRRLVAAAVLLGAGLYVCLGVVGALGDDEELEALAALDRER